MGCMESSHRIHASLPNIAWEGKSESVSAALVRVDEELVGAERTNPAARLAVVNAELGSIQQEINSFEVTTDTSVNKESYAKTIHQLLVSLDLYRRPVLASDNEDFIANVNRKEMQSMELSWLRTRHGELQRERKLLHAQILRTRALYAKQRQLLDSIWSTSIRPGAALEGKLSRAVGLRDALASVSARLRAAAEYSHSAGRLVDDALPAWKLSSVGKATSVTSATQAVYVEWLYYMAVCSVCDEFRNRSGWERTLASAEACQLLVKARCLERSARRVLVATAAPRAARALRLALDYAFTDSIHDHKFQRATEIFLQFKDALNQLISSIHQVLLSNLENLAVAQKDVTKYRLELRTARTSDLVRRGIAEMRYHPTALTNLKTTSSL